jgi:hypothetical protein
MRTSVVPTLRESSCTQALVVQRQTEIVWVHAREFFPEYVTLRLVSEFETPEKTPYQELLRVPDVVESTSK